MDYLGEHELTYLGGTYIAGAVPATAIGFWRRSRNSTARVEVWALFGGLVGFWLGVWMIVLAPLLSQTTKGTVVRLLLPFIIVPPLALIVVGSLGSGVTAAVVGLVLAGAVGAVATWYAFGGRIRTPPREGGHTEASVVRVTRVAQNGRHSEAHTEAGLIAHVR